MFNLLFIYFIGSVLHVLRLMGSDLEWFLLCVVS